MFLIAGRHYRLFQFRHKWTRLRWTEQHHGGAATTRLWQTGKHFTKGSNGGVTCIKNLQAQLWCTRNRRTSAVYRQLVWCWRMTQPLVFRPTLSKHTMKAVTQFDWWWEPALVDPSITHF